DRRRQTGDRRRGEERAERQVDPEEVAHARENAGGDERVAAEGEEVVVPADSWMAQDLRPEAGQPLLQGRPRGEKKWSPRPIRGGPGPPARGRASRSSRGVRGALQASARSPPAAPG